MWRIFSLLIQWILTVRCLDLNETGLVVKTKFEFNPPLIPTGHWPPYVHFLHYSDIVIDKSLFVKDIIEDKGKVFLITCPSSWGKTLNIRLLRAFFEIEPDEQGYPLPFAATRAYRLFVHGEGYYMPNKTFKFIKPFLIAQHNNIIENHLCQYPVFFIDLYTSLIDNDFTTIVSSLARCIYTPFARYRYVQKIINKAIDESGDEKEKAQGRAYLKLFDDFKFRTEIIDPDVIQKSLRILSEIMNKYLKKKVIILIDSYHNTWEGLFLHKSSLFGERQKIIDYYVGFIKETFIDNPYIEKGVLTGALRPSDELYQAVFHQIIECNPLTGKFMEYFGFNQFEMQHLIPYLNITKDVEHEMKQVFNGYKINNKNLHIYNPFDVAEFTWNRTVSGFWVDIMKKNKMILNCIRVIPFKKKLYNLLDGSDVVVKVERDHFTWKEYDVVIRAIHQLTFIDADFGGKLFLMLYDVGYLTMSRDVDLTANVKYYRFKIPNEQVRANMKAILRVHLDRPNRTTITTTTTTEIPTTPDLSI